MEPPTLAELIAEAKAELVLLQAQTDDMRESLASARSNLRELKQVGEKTKDAVRQSYTNFKRLRSTQF